jgi:hypothetical protein
MMSAILTDLRRASAFRTAAAAILAGLLGTQGCGAGWHQRHDLPPGVLRPRQQVQVWQGGHALRWHAVAMTADSVTGIPFLKPATCDSCRVAVPRSSVDSLRFGNPVAGFWKTIGLVVGIPMLLFAIICSTSRKGGPPCGD